RKRGSAFLMALLCVTMISGVKMSGLAYAGLVMALALWLYVSNRLTGRAGPQWRETLREQRLMAGLVLVSAGLLGGSWYVRNVLVSGNPLGFVQIVILGRVLYPGEATQAWVNQTNLLHNFSPMSSHHWGVLGESAAAFPRPAGARTGRARSCGSVSIVPAASRASASPGAHGRVPRMRVLVCPRALEREAR